MKVRLNIFAVLLLASALSLSSCVNQVNQPKSQNTLSHLAIIYSIPDSNKILTVDFHAIMTPPWQKNYRIDWNFGDSTGIISKFDTSNLIHNYQKYGSYLVTLSIFDTVSKAVLGKTSIPLDLENNVIDTNFLKRFTKCTILFFGIREYNDHNFDQNSGISDRIVSDTTLRMGIILHGSYSIPSLTWNGNHFQVFAHGSWRDSLNYWQFDNGSEGFMLSGDISFSGNAIDSGLFQYSYNYNQSLRIGQGSDHSGTMFQFITVPFQNKDTNSMTFFYQGQSLQSHIIQYKDSSNGNFNNSGYSKKLINILWNQPPTPTLTVTFSK